MITYCQVLLFAVTNFSDFAHLQVEQQLILAILAWLSRSSEVCAVWERRKYLYNKYAIVVKVKLSS